MSKLRFGIALVLAPVFGLSVLAGCETDRVIEEDTTVKTKDDGTVVKEQDRLIEQPDGSIVKEESKSVDRPGADEDREAEIDVDVDK